MSTDGPAQNPDSADVSAGSGGEPASMRDRIKALTLDLLIQYGYRGMSFADLAAALETTRANIHYHFGNKQTLVEEVLVAYTRDTIAGTAAVFDLPGVTLGEKIERIVAYTRRKHDRYNAPGAEGRPWSLIARMRRTAPT